VKFINFQPNQPQSFTFPSCGAYKLPEGKGALIPLEDGQTLFLGQMLADSLALLKLQAGEEFVICLYMDRGKPHWECWLASATEKARAAAELAQMDLEAKLSASIKLVQGRKERSSGEASVPGYLAPTGTEGPSALPLPSPKRAALAVASAGGKRRREGKIPYNVAFREIVTLVAGELAQAGEQWSDQARQDAVSTLFIAAGKAGWLEVWEREEEAA